ncbi:MAG: FAD binding domain-containing protein [Saccharofermentans sp.]|nr:FAD binding domain-containing protein [Saccharofermentans sp.]
MFTIQKYVRAQSLEEAYELNQGKNNRIVAGMLWLRLGKGRVNTAIDLTDLGLNTIEEDDEKFSIGAMVSLRSLEQHESLNSYTNNAVCNAVKDIVGVQFRNLATIGGSIWGRFGFSDVLTVFLAMDSYVELYKGGIIPLSEFATMKKDKDIIVRIIVKKIPLKIAYRAMRAQRTDFPVLACATSIVDGKARAVVGARPARAKLIMDDKDILTSGISEESKNTFVEYVANNIPTSSNLRGSAEYRTHLLKVLTSRNLTELEEIK